MGLIKHSFLKYPRGFTSSTGSLHFSLGTDLQELLGMGLTAACSSVWLKQDSGAAEARRGMCLRKRGTYLI